MPRPRRLRPPRLQQLELRLAPAFAAFRLGDGSTIAQDAEISAATPAATNAAAPAMTVAGPAAPGGERQTLLRLDNIFGTGTGQIPANATIQNATLTLWAISASSPSAGVDIRRMLQPWSDATATWDAFVNGIQPDNVECLATADAAPTLGPTGFQITGQLLKDSVTAWSQGAPGRGWVLMARNPSAAWTFAGCDDPDPSRRPQLTVQYTVAGTGNPSYAQLSGQPPEPTKLAWFTWADDLRSRRLARVPNDRPNTFFFAQNGDDITGQGTAASPWKSLAKAQQVIDLSRGGVRLRFRRGDVWQETTALTVTGDGLTVDDYGDAGLAKPRFSRFLPLDPHGWEHVSGDLYKLVNPPDVGWVRGALTPYLDIFYRAESSAEVGARPFSWHYDAAGTDQNSVGLPSLYVNVAADPFFYPGGLEACPGDGLGWQVEGDNVRLENLKLEGQGIIKSGQGYGLRVVHHGAFWEFAGVGLEVYYTGYHAIGQIGQYQGNNSVVTLVDVRAGLCANRNGTGGAGSGDITVFVSYADFGGNEYYQYNCEMTYGALPSSDWAAAPGLAQGQGFYSHIGSGGFHELVICQGTRVGTVNNPLELINQIDSAAPAGSLAEVRAYIVEDQPGRIASWWNKANVAVVNCVVDRRTPPQLPGTGQAAFVYGSLGIGGWVINGTIAVDATYQTNGQYLVLYSGFSNTKLINCHIDVYNAPNTVFLTNPNLDPSVFWPDSSMTNTVFSLHAGAMTGVGLVNDPDRLKHNAYYLANASTNPWHTYANDAGAVTLPARFPVGLQPSPSSPLFDGGADVGLEFDQRRSPRGNRRTIGALAGASLPTPTTVAALWGSQSQVLTPGAMLSSPAVNRLALTFPSPVDVHRASLTLWDDVGPVAISEMAYDAPTRTGTWTTLLPLPPGRYIAELDGIPVAGFSVLPGDMTGNCCVDALDFFAFRNAFGGLAASADFDGDGDIDAGDFVTFRQAYGTSL